MSSAKSNPKKRKKTRKGKDGKSPQWCFCKKPPTEDMIACENPGCSVEWFHMECVNIDPYNVPGGDWFCRKCTDKAARDAMKIYGEGLEVDTTMKPSKSATKSASKSASKSTPKIALRPAQKLSPKKSSKPIFICEWCESEFPSKLVCITHKNQCRKNFKLPTKPDIAASTSGKMSGPNSPVISNPTPPSFAASHEVISLSSRSPTPPVRSQSRSPNSTQGDGDASNRTQSFEPSLEQFSNDQILACLEERKAAFVCVCGIVFEDQTLYFLHRGCHNTTNPRKCSFCNYEAPDWYAFTTHFFQHKSSKTVAPPSQ